MSEQLKRLMQRARLMAPADEQGGAGGGSGEDDFVLVIEGEGEGDNNADENGDAADNGGTQTTIADDEHKDPVKAESEDDEDEEENAVEGETDEQKRERRRKERQDRKLRQKEREETTKRELASERRARQELEARLAAIEGKDRGRDLAQVDEAIRKASSGYEHWKAKLAEAMEQHDGEAATKATEKMMEARDAQRQLANVKTAYEKSQTQQARPAIDPVMQNHASKFIQDHNWFKHGSNDLDSRIVTQLDNTLAEEGWNPATPEYWDELRSRIKKYLPHRVAGGKVGAVDKQTTSRTSKSVVGGGGGESSGSGGKQVFKLSKERVQALKDAGQWNDPKAREAGIKAYRDYDKQHAKKG